MYSALAPLVGALITVMNVVNSRLAVRVGAIPAVVIIHAVGLAAVSTVLPLLRLGRGSGRGRGPGYVPGRLPVYAYLGGLVGVGTVFCTTYAYAALGASLAVALALIGQTLFAVAADATGLLGRRVHPLAARRIPGICLAVAGAAVMAESWRVQGPAMLVALLSGALPGLSFILNSELGRKKGLAWSTWVNYAVGLGTILVITAAVRPAFDPALAAAAGPLLLAGGALMGVAVVTGMSFIFPRVSAFSATLLVFCGQAVTGVAMDAALEGRLDARKLAGTLVLLGGLALDTVLSRKAAAVPGPSR